MGHPVKLKVPPAGRLIFWAAALLVVEVIAGVQVVQRDHQRQVYGQPATAPLVRPWRRPPLIGEVKPAAVYTRPDLAAAVAAADTPAGKAAAKAAAQAAAGLASAAGAGVAKPAGGAASASGGAAEKRFRAYLTAYTFFDNTPPSSAEISNPILHAKAGGTGTFGDPITVAVGHTITGGKDLLDFAAGTRFYVPNVRRYFIVEDTCGDGPTPQSGPCHVGYPAGTSAWLDLWIDGASGGNASSTDNCASKVTDPHLVIQNPASGYAVVAGPVFQNGTCTALYGDTVASP